jgi:hypothetical protein
MGFGIAFSGFAWIAAGTIRLAIDGGDAASISWQVLPYAFTPTHFPVLARRFALACRTTLRRYCS